jgi:hypothetical protein
MATEYISSMEFGDAAMNDTPNFPTQEELNEYIRRSHMARSEAIVAIFRWIRAKLTRHPQAPVGARYA